jgi:hypothetical protein
MHTVLVHPAITSLFPIKVHGLPFILSNYQGDNYNPSQSPLGFIFKYFNGHASG